MTGTRSPQISSVLKKVLILCVGGFLVAAPFLVESFALFELTTVLCYVTVLIGMNLLTGYGGQVSLGHGAFAALGAYSYIVLITLGVPFWPALIGIGVICFIAGFAFGFPALRLSGHHLALATFALAVATPQFIKIKAFEPWTGGSNGSFIPLPEAPAWFAYGDEAWFYYICVGFTLLSLIVAVNILRGRSGTAIRAIKDNPTAAAAMGIDVARYKTLVFGVSTTMAGLAGAGMSIQTQYVSPESFTLVLSIIFLVGLVVGGIGSLWGAVLGALFLQYVPYYTEQVSEVAPAAVFGALLLLTIFFMPRGLAGAAASATRRLGRK
ncbi:branched-chain amino acid ABC transporter permease [Sulfitobacter sp. EhC04]|uniref:branched-chain amino acid ABC transporter permease n=1 Tax=Sulfitobacter sp. EhC04 TaxID=1849168 RepID=UPI001373231C|nr:branched-chain amino acid ABC transporter permease [Sulfitobacter sp. EhC04]